jgi:hypothetical protein
LDSVYTVTVYNEDSTGIYSAQLATNENIYLPINLVDGYYRVVISSNNGGYTELLYLIQNEEAIGWMSVAGVVNVNLDCILYPNYVLENTVTYAGYGSFRFMQIRSTLEAYILFELQGNKLDTITSEFIGGVPYNIIAASTPLRVDTSVIMDGYTLNNRATFTTRCL